MVKVIEHEFEQPRFLTRKEFEEIKIRHNRLPPGKYKATKNGEIYIWGKTLSGSTKILTVEHPGLTHVIEHVQKDMQRLIQHVEMADEENDKIKEENNFLRAELISLQDHDIDDPDKHA